MSGVAKLEYDVSTKQKKLPEGTVTWPSSELSHFTENDAQDKGSTVEGHK